MKNKTNMSIEFDPDFLSITNSAKNIIVENDKFRDKFMIVKQYKSKANSLALKQNAFSKRSSSVWYGVYNLEEKILRIYNSIFDI